MENCNIGIIRFFRAPNSKAEILGNLIGQISAFHVLNFDYAPLNMIAEEAIKDGDVVFAVFYDENMQPLTDSDSKFTDPKFSGDKSDLLVSRFKIEDNNKKIIAWFEIGLSKNKLSRSFYSSLKIIIVSVVLTLFFLIFGIKRILKLTVINPVNEIVSISKEITENGDLTKFFNTKTSDEFGYLAVSLNTMCRKIEKIVKNTSEISKGLAASSSKEASSVETTSSALEEISSMSKKTLINVNKIGQYMKEAEKTCRYSDSDMKNLCVEMDIVAEKSNSIINIIKIIDAISFQTNLLALNASVEAARAGESGAGFGVVANEVRNLAVQSANSVKDSTELVNETVNKIIDVRKLVKKADKAFSQLSGLTIQVSEMTENAVSAFQEQSIGIEQINKSIYEISIITQQNAQRADSLWNEIKWFTTSDSI